MRIAVIGAGGIGGIYGAALAKAGADVDQHRTFGSADQASKFFDGNAVDG